MRQRSAISPEGTELGQEVVLADSNAVEHRGAAGRQALPEAVPVVPQFKALCGAGDGDAAQFVVAVFRDGYHPVGIERAGRIELLAREQQAVFGIALDAGFEVVAVARIALGMGAADHGAFGNARDPQVARGGWRGQQDRFHEQEMRAEDLREVGVCGRKVEQDFGKLRYRKPGAAVCQRQAQRTESAPGEFGNILMGELAFPVARGGLGADLGQKIGKVEALCLCLRRFCAPLGGDGHDVFPAKLGRGRRGGQASVRPRA